jgi:hypothetical protein
MSGRHVVWRIITNVSREAAASIFEVYRFESRSEHEISCGFHDFKQYLQERVVIVLQTRPQPPPYTSHSLFTDHPTIRRYEYTVCVANVAKQNKYQTLLLLLLLLLLLFF